MANLMTDAFAPNAALQKFGLLLAAIALIPIASLEHACLVRLQ
jgi:hypothetical protein